MHFPDSSSADMTTRAPDCKWAQRKDKVMFTINVPDLNPAKAKVEITETLFSFEVSQFLVVALAAYLICSFEFLTMFSNMIITFLTSIYCRSVLWQVRLGRGICNLTSLAKSTRARASGTWPRGTCPLSLSAKPTVHIGINCIKGPRSPRSSATGTSGKMRTRRR